MAREFNRFARSFSRSLIRLAASLRSKAFLGSAGSLAPGNASSSISSNPPQLLRLCNLNWYVVPVVKTARLSRNGAEADQFSNRCRSDREHARQVA